MSIKPHYIHLYQPPRQGAGYVSQFPALNYRHSIIARGGFDTASFILQLSRGGAELAFDNYLGCVVRGIVDNPDEPIWEGFINRMTWRIGGVSVTRSLDNMMNRVSVTYYNATSAAATKTEITAVIDDAASQAVYGVKEGSIDAGIHFNNADKTHKTQLRNLLSTIYSWPQVSVSSGGNDEDGVIEVECKGLQYFAWDWANYNRAFGSAGEINVNAGRAISLTTMESGHGSSLLPPNGSLVYVTGGIGSSAMRDWINNGSFNIQLASEGGQTYLQYLQGVAEAGGTGPARYVFGISAPDPVDGLRYVYYRPASTAIKYTTYALSDTGKLRDVYGRLVKPWMVRPDAGVRINDILQGWNEAGDDPRIGYIESIEYDAEAGTVQWQTGDDVTLEGAMQRKKRYKQFKANDPFAANTRQAL